MTYINIEFTAKDALKAVKRSDVIIVIDVLRCSSTIITALANGAKSIIPVKTVKEALKIHRLHPTFILAGERKGVKPKGFSLGNSPLEFQTTKVSGKQIVITTTNGTKALTWAKGGRFVLVGAFLNIEAVIDAALRIAERENRGLSLVLAGKQGRFSLEDYLCAGAMVESLPTQKIENSDSAQVALLAFCQVRDSLDNIISKGSHAKYLKSIGLDADVHFCCKQNRYRVVPYFREEMIPPLKIKILNLDEI